MKLRIDLTNSNDFKDYRGDYLFFLKKIAEDKSLASVNMGLEDNTGFLFLVDNLKRWTKDNGEIALLYDNITENIVGLSAVEPLYINPLLGSGGNRCWVLPKHRVNNEVTSFLLKSNLAWCEKNDKVGMVLTFNNHNKWIYDTITKLSSNTGTTLGTVWSKWWNDCIPLPRKIRYFNTHQWAIIKPIDKSQCLKIAADIDKRYGVREHLYLKIER